MSETFFRRVWRWHFWAGLIACPVLLVIALTGALYTFREEIEDWQQSEMRFVEPVGEPKPMSLQLRAVYAAHPDWKPTRVTVSPDPRKTTVVLVERPNDEPGATPAVYVNPYTATIVAEGEARSAFFAGVLKLHRSLFAGTVGRILVELATSWSIVLIASGLFLWLPARWNRVWGVWLPRLRSPSYVALRDLHTIGGTILAPVLALLAGTGLFYTVVWLWSFNAVSNGAGQFPRDLLTAPASAIPPTPAPATTIDVAVAAARERFPDRVLTLQLPKKPTESFAIPARETGSSLTSGSVGVDPYTGQVVSEKRAEHLPGVEQARLYVLPIHMGTIGGLPTKILAFLACLGLVGLCVSGIGMWLVRRPEGRSGFPRASEARVPKPAVVLILVLAICLPDAFLL